MLNKEQITQYFEDSLSKQPWWSKLMGSQFSIGIINFMSQVIYRCLSLVTRELAEAHLSLAIRPASILAAADNKSYVRAKITPSVGSAVITNNDTVSRYVPENTQVNSSEGVSYTTDGAVNLAAGESVAVQISQLLRKRVTTTVSGDTDYLELLLTKEDSANAHKVDVLVDDGGGTVKWTRSYLFRNGNDKSTIYVEFYTPTEQLGIRFGNGVLAKRLVGGSLVSLDIWLTEGETTLITGQALTFVDLQYSAISAVTSTPIVGGLPQESIESVRKGALYSSSFNGEVVWSGDYHGYISSALPAIEWITVWGEQEQEAETGFDIRNINNIFICAYSRVFDQPSLHQQIAALFANQELFNLKLTFVDVKLVPLTINLTGKIEPQRDIVATKATLSAAISEYYGENAAIRLDEDGNLIEIRSKELWRFIDNLGILTDFDLSVPNITVPRGLPDYRYIDVETSTIVIER
jgi:hypothetical protein